MRQAGGKFELVRVTQFPLWKCEAEGAGKHICFSAASHLLSGDVASPRSGGESNLSSPRGQSLDKCGEESYTHVSVREQVPFLERTRGNNEQQLISPTCTRTISSTKQGLFFSEFSTLVSSLDLPVHPSLLT